MGTEGVGWRSAGPRQISGTIYLVTKKTWRTTWRFTCAVSGEKLETRCRSYRRNPLPCRGHLLRHYREGRVQEDLCFGLWHPSRGRNRLTAILADLVLPQPGEVHLHGNASFEGSYVTRAIREARKRNAGVALLHSHPSVGWQDLSDSDVVAERDEVAHPAQATGKPLLGMTMGADGSWSARLWEKENDRMVGTWCRKVRVPAANRYGIHWRPSALISSEDSEFQHRTIATWGVANQRCIENMRVGIVGLGSVGALVAEALARVGVSEITLIDPDTIERHNLDRLLHADRSSIGELKVCRARTEALRSSTARDVQIIAIPAGVQREDAYREALDCDLIVSCVDRPVARDVLNYIATSHLIPVIEGGVAVELESDAGDFESARWRSHVVAPGHACIRCAGQYNSSEVVQELDGSMDDPSYISNLPSELRPRQENVFPFSLGSAGMQVNLLVRYLIGDDWWPAVSRQEYRFVAARTYVSSTECGPNCSFRERVACGDRCSPSYLVAAEPQARSRRSLARKLIRACRGLLTALPWARTIEVGEVDAGERIQH